MTAKERLYKILTDNPDYYPLFVGWMTEYQVKKDLMLKENPNLTEKDTFVLLEGLFDKWFKTDYPERFMKYHREKEKLLEESENLPAQEFAVKLAELAKKYNV